MSLTSLQKDFFVRAGLTVLGTSTVTTSSGNTSTLQVEGGAAIAKNLIVGQQSEFYGTLNAYNNVRLNVTTASVLTVTGRSTLGEVTAGATTVSNLVVTSTLNVTGRSTLGEVTAGATTATTINVTGRSTLGEVSAGSTTATTFNATGVSRFTDSTVSTSPTSGALQVTGGVGINGALFVGGGINGTVTTATNLAGGASGGLPYQTAPGVTTFLPIGTAGFILQSDGSTATWVNTSSVAFGIANTASNLQFGGQYQIPYQTGAGQTAFEAGFEYNFNTNVFTVDNAVINASTNATSTATGSLQVRGGVGVNRSVWVGENVNVTGNVVATGDLIANGGDLQTNQTTFNLLNTTATTINFGGAGTAIAIGAASGTTTIKNNALVEISTEATSTATGALQVRGGLGVNRDIWVGQRLNVAGDAIVTGDVTVNGGDLQTSQTTFNLLNTTATTVNAFGAGTNITVGASGSGSTTVRNRFTVTDTTNATSTVTGALHVKGGAGIQQDVFVGGKVVVEKTDASTGTVSANALYVAGGVGIGRSLFVTGPAIFNDNVVFAGTSTYVYSTNTVYTDNILNMHVPSGSTGTNHSWSVNDGKDIGFVFHYYDTTDKDAFLGIANDTKWLEWYDNGTETLGGGTFTGTSYGIFKTGGIRLVHTTASSNTTTGALVVTGGVGIGGALNVGQATLLNETLSVTGIATVTNETDSSSTSTGALQVRGGAGIHRALTVGGNTTLLGNIEVRGGNVTTNQTSFNLINATATTVNFAGAATALILGATTGATTVRNATTVSNNSNASSTSTGALVVYGGVGINQDLRVGGVIYGNLTGLATTATNLAGGAQGGLPYQTANGTTAFIPIGTSGFILSSNGTTATWVSTSSVAFGQATTASNLQFGAQYQIPYQTGAGATAFEAGFEYNFTSNTFSVDNTIINGSTDATSTATGSLQVRGGVGVNRSMFVGGNINVTGNVVATGDLIANGGDLITNQATFLLVNSTSTTVNFAGSATTITIGAASGTTTVRNNVLVDISTEATSTATGALQVRGGIGVNRDVWIGQRLNVAGDAIVTGDVTVNGGDLQTSQTTFNLLNTTATTVNAFGAATAITLGATTGNTNIRNTVTVTNITEATSTATGALVVWGGVGINRSAWIGQRLNVAGDAIVTGDVTVNGGDLQTGATTFNLINTTATTVNFAGASTAMTIGASSNGFVSIRNLTNAVATNDGALRVAGGIGVVKDMYVGGVITAGATQAATTGSTVSGVFYNNTLLASFTSNAIASTSTQNLDSFSASAYRSAKYFCQVTMGSNIHVSEISVMHDGTKAYITEYAILTNSGQLGSYNADYSGGNVTITWTPNSATSHVVKLTRTTVTV